MAAPETDFDEGYGWVQQCHEYPRWTFTRHLAHTRTQALGFSFRFPVVLSFTPDDLA